MRASLPYSFEKNHTKSLPILQNMIYYTRIDMHYHWIIGGEIT